MKKPFCVLAALATSLTSTFANPEIPAAVSLSFGNAVAGNILLLKGSAATAEPSVWMVYAQDVFRPQEQLRIKASLSVGGWKAEPAGAGQKVLSPAPTQPIDFVRL